MSRLCNCHRVGIFCDGIRCHCISLLIDLESNFNPSRLCGHTQIEYTYKGLYVPIITENQHEMLYPKTTEWNLMKIVYVVSVKSFYRQTFFITNRFNKT